MMPHLSDLQRRYQADKVHAISVTARDVFGTPGNTLDPVAEFVKSRGSKYRQSFAYDEGAALAEQWLGAAGRKGLPCTFVVDKAGRIAYIGQPFFADLVVSKVLACGADALTVSGEMARIEADYNEICVRISKDPPSGLSALRDFEVKYPLMTDALPSIRAKLSFLPKHGKAGEARAYASNRLTKATQAADPIALRMLASILRLGEGRHDRELLAISVQAAEAVVRLVGDTKPHALLDLALAYSAFGDTERARQFAEKAVAAAAGETPEVKEDIRRQAQPLLGKKP
jgi:hypothetical protein